MNNRAESCSGRWEVCPAGVCQDWVSFPELFHFYTLPTPITCVCNTYACISLSYMCVYIYSAVYIYIHICIFLIFFLLYINN